MKGSQVQILSARLAMDYRCSDDPIGESEFGTAGFGRSSPSEIDGSCQPDSPSLGVIDVVDLELPAC